MVTLKTVQECRIDQGDDLRAQTDVLCIGRV